MVLPHKYTQTGLDSDIAKQEEELGVLGAPRSLRSPGRRLEALRAAWRLFPAASTQPHWVVQAAGEGTVLAGDKHII